MGTDLDLGGGEEELTNRQSLEAEAAAAAE